MVKNQGGNKAKRVARKNIVIPTSRSLREKDPNETSEIYACVIKLSGGANCEVICEDGVIRNCIIRNKFRGRSKRDNLIASKVWILVGLRDWECKDKKKKEGCDLLCVYSDDEKTELKKKLNCNWSNFAAAFPEDQIDIENVGIDFINEDCSENQSLIKEIEDNLNDTEEPSDDLIDVDEI